MKVNFEIRFNRITKVITGITATLLIGGIVYANNGAIGDLYKYALNDFGWNHNTNTITTEGYRLDGRNILEDTITGQEIMDGKIKSVDLDSTDSYTMSGLTVDNDMEVAGNVTTSLPTTNSHGATKQYVDTVVGATSAGTTGTAGGGGGSITLVGGTKTYSVDTIVSCPVGYTSAMEGYWQCQVLNPGLNTANIGSCFCSSNTKTDINYRNADIISTSEFNYSGSNSYNRCNVCIQNTQEHSYIGKRMFATSVGYNAGTEVDADAKCQSRADAAGLNSNFKAWYLDGTGDLKIYDKFADTTYINMKGQKVITTFLDYNGGYTGFKSLENTIAYDEFGRKIITSENVWTGLDRNGLHNNILSQVSYGSVREIDTGYYYMAGSFNNRKYRFICVEY